MLVSRCLEFDRVRYDGQVIHSQIVRDLEPFVDYIKVCPEYEIGLGVPRDSIRMVLKDGKYRLIQPKTGQDVTERMNVFTMNFLSSLDIVDGFIFKSKSPTIGLRNIKVYAGIENAPVVERSIGFFAGQIMEKYPGYPMEEEDRLRNMRIRHHFLTCLYTFADFRIVKSDSSFEAVTDFLKRNRFLFLAYNKDIQLRMFGLAEDSIRPHSSLLEELESLLKQLMARPPDHLANIEAARSMFYSVASKLSENEIKFFKALIERYEQNRVCFASVKELLKLYTIMTGEDPEYHTFLHPYPDELIPEVDENRDKDFWK